MLESSKVASSLNVGPYQVSETIHLTSVWETDAQELHRILNINENIANGLYSAEMIFPFPMANAISFIERCNDNQSNSDGVNSWAIRQSVDGPIIGHIGLETTDHHGFDPCFKEAEGSPMNCCLIRYWISPEHEGKGVATKVVRYVVDSIAPKLGYERVHAGAWEENISSARVMLKVGMRQSQGDPCFVPKFNTMRNTTHFIKDLQ